jgi:chromosomal replication initiator protein
MASANGVASSFSAKGVGVISVGGTFSIPLGSGVDFDGGPRKGSSPGRSALPLREFIADDQNSLLRTLLPSLEQPSACFAPLVLYGPTSVGKTALALALVRRWEELSTSPRTLLITAADFARAYAHAVDIDAIGEFRDRFAQASLVVIDDMQHLEGKRPAQAEIRYLLDLMAAQGTRVIITSRIAPAELAFAPDLCSRLAGGLVVPLQWPGVEARREMVVRYLAHRHVTKLSQTSINRIADTYAGPPSRLFAALAHLLHVAETQREAIDDRLVDAALAEQAEATVSPRAIIATVAKHFRVTVKDMKGPSRKRAINEARGVAMHLLRTLTRETYEQIGAHFTDRDHTTVMHACQKTTERLAADPQLAQAVDRIVAHLQEGT